MRIQNPCFCVIAGMNLSATELSPTFAIIRAMSSLEFASTKLPQAQAEDKLTPLLAAMAKGDEQALGAFYDATVNRVFGLALRIVRQRDSAEEVVEEVYLQAWQQAARYDSSRGKPLTWLLTICRSRALDYLRRADEAISHPEPETLADELYDERADPEALLLAVERNTQLYAILNELSPVQRQLLALAFFRGLTHQEIADHTQLPLGTIKSHVRKALEQMRERLEQGN